MLMLASGSRDRKRFDDPDRFDPDRRDNQHLGFGSGIHLCFGGPLARRETQIALTELVRRLDRPRLVADPPPYRPSPVLRGPIHLDIEQGGTRPRGNRGPLEGHAAADGPTLDSTATRYPPRLPSRPPSTHTLWSGRDSWRSGGARHCAYDYLAGLAALLVPPPASWSTACPPSTLVADVFVARDDSVEHHNHVKSQPERIFGVGGLPFISSTPAGSSPVPAPADSQPSSRVGAVARDTGPGSWVRGGRAHPPAYREVSGVGVRCAK